MHLALASLRNHRSATAGPLSSMAAVSLLLAALPWLFPSAIGLALGIGVHVAWFVVCERLAPVQPAGRKTAQAPPAPRPASAPRPSPARPQGFVQVPVLAAFDETPDIKTIRLARPDGFEFSAGQFVAVRVRVDGKDCSRCYSVSSAPEVRGYLEISVKRHGLVSNALHVMARPGALLSVRSPNGAFTYPSGDDRPIVLVAGGVGITPLISMLRHAVHTEPARAVTLLYSARSEADFAFRDEIAALVRRNPQARACLASSRASSAEIYPGRIDAALIRATVPDIAHSICMVCGPLQMIDLMKGLLPTLGVPAAQIRHEVFEAAVAASAARDKPEATTATARQARASFDVTCAQSGKTMPIAPGQTLLEAADAAGIPLESLCRAGICGTCRTRVTKGEVECASDALSAEERAGGLVLACVATAQSNCTIDL